MGLLTVRRRRLTASGVQPVGLVQHPFEWCYMYGAVAPTTGERLFLEWPYLHADTFQRFVDALAQAFPDRLNLRLLDNSGAHTAQRLRWPANMQPVWLPPYGPELNPSARVWRDVMDDLAWQQFADLEAQQVYMSVISCRPITPTRSRHSPVMHTDWKPFMHWGQSKLILHGVIAGMGLGDDPSLSRLKIEWSPISGPGNVSFTNSHALDTEASFTEYGAYMLRLSMDNSQLPPALAQVTIHVNQAPVISASADTIITLPANAMLSGEVVDLGLPDLNGTVTRTWAKVSGPGEVIFADTHALTTTARFTQSGIYVVRLTVETGADGYHLQSEGEVTVVVNQSPEDIAGSGAPVDLVLEDPSGSPEPITWLNPGLRLNTPVILKAAAATQLIRKIKTPARSPLRRG
jgi:DDE superfamily endonuclease